MSTANKNESPDNKSVKFRRLAAVLTLEHAASSEISAKAQAHLYGQVASLLWLKAFVAHGKLQIG